MTGSPFLNGYYLYCFYKRNSAVFFFLPLEIYSLADNSDPLLCGALWAVVRNSVACRLIPEKLLLFVEYFNRKRRTG